MDFKSENEKLHEYEKPPNYECTSGSSHVPPPTSTASLPYGKVIELYSSGLSDSSQAYGRTWEIKITILDSEIETRLRQGGSYLPSKGFCLKEERESFLTQDGYIGMNRWKTRVYYRERVPEGTKPSWTAMMERQGYHPAKHVYGQTEKLKEALCQWAQGTNTRDQVLFHYENGGIHFNAHPLCTSNRYWPGISPKPYPGSLSYLAPGEQMRAPVDAQLLEFHRQIEEVAGK